MRTCSALEVRRRFGQILDEAARGERIVVERAGQPIAALVPLSDLALVDPEQKKARQLAALEELRRLAVSDARKYGRPALDAATVVRRQRDARTRQITRNAERRRRPPPGQ